MPDATSGTPWGAIAGVGGQVLGAIGEASAARKKNRILAEGSRQQNRAGMESAGVMGDFLAQLRNSQANPGAERAAFTGAVRGPGISGVPGASAAFRGDAQTRGAGAQGYGRTMADLFARVRAPAQQRRAESQSMVEVGNRLQPIQARAQDDQFLTELRSGVTQPNPWLSTVAGMLQQGGKYASSQGY